MIISIPHTNSITMVVTMPGPKRMHTNRPKTSLNIAPKAMILHTFGAQMRIVAQHRRVHDVVGAPMPFQKNVNAEGLSEKLEFYVWPCPQPKKRAIGNPGAPNNPKYDLSIYLKPQGRYCLYTWSHRERHRSERQRQTLSMQSGKGQKDQACLTVRVDCPEGPDTS